ncbi:MepB family protein [Flavobacterium sp. UBA7663]|uniref:MepB family protein n=1 Tax=Flavobacterium sp. UBA7663 TaxID=1946557 RepID=UPI0025BC250E|nr:MepB family protein [Flavobacterium sp. UBA7663]
MATESFQTDLQLAEKLLYNECGFQFQNLIWNPESTNYGACSFELNNYKIQFRVANITPTKIGQFVAIWKRNSEGITAPFDVADSLDFMIISVRDSENFGQFIFPKSVLVAKGIVSQNGKGGKRGIRVYAPWDKPENKQAIQTQAWQVLYFIEIKENSLIDLEKIKRILSNG